MQIPLVDLRAQYQAIKHEVLAEFEDVLEHMQLFLGPHSQAFEQEFAAYCGCQYGVGLSSGTDALALARAYTEQLQGVVETVPVERSWGKHVYYVYVVQVAERDQFRQALERAGIATGVHYPVPIHLQQACTRYGYRRGTLPVTEAVAERIISLPMYPELTVQQREQVVKAVKQRVASRVSIR